MTIVGIDPSLTSTGVANIHNQLVTAGVVTSTGHRGDTLPARIARITGLIDHVLDWVPLDSLVIIEGPSYGSIGGSAWDRAGYWHRLVRRLEQHGCRIAVVAPTTRAQWATGSGRADKAAVAAAIARMVPTKLVSSDAADAVTMALMGAAHLGLRPDLITKARTDVLAKVQWPDTLDAAACVVPALSRAGEALIEPTP